MPSVYLRIGLSLLMIKETDLSRIRGVNLKEHHGHGQEFVRGKRERDGRERESQNRTP